MQAVAVLHTIVAWVLAIFFVGAGIAHFASMRKFFVAIVPKALPYPGLLVQVTGVLEMLGGVGLLIHPLARLTGILLMIFLVAVFPANIQAARLHLPYSNPLWLRGAAQVVLIGLVAWVALVT